MSDKKEKGNKKRDGEQVSKRTKQAEWLLPRCLATVISGLGSCCAHLC
jgi:hypothetical protein